MKPSVHEISTQTQTQATNRDAIIAPCTFTLTLGDLKQNGFTWMPQVLADEVISPLVSQPYGYLLVAGRTIFRSLLPHNS